MKKKQGISLIVLVITIIVMIIIAASVVITLSNTGIINKANMAKEITSKKQMEDFVAMLWAEAYIEGARTKQELNDAVNDKLEGIDTSNYSIIVTENGITIEDKKKVDLTAIPDEWKESIYVRTSEGVPIPKGFVVSPYEGENKLSEGVVIYALTSTEIANNLTTLPESETHQTSLETRNQFVWIPVNSETFSSANSEFRRINYMNDKEFSNKLGVGMWEIVLDENNMPLSTQDTSYVSNTTLTEAKELYTSVKKYGGFYIGRYEASMDSNSKITVTMAKIPYNSKNWGSSMANETYSSGAVTLSRGLYKKENEDYSVVSTLTYGVQHDRAIACIESEQYEKGNMDFSAKKSTGYGNYADTQISAGDFNKNAKYVITNSSGTITGNWVSTSEQTIRTGTTTYWMMTTGALKQSKLYNIYDIAGNMWEWIMEGDATAKRAGRGGAYMDMGYDQPLGQRTYGPPTTTFEFSGFRVSLYVK